MGRLSAWGPIDVQFRVIDGLRVRYARGEPGNGRPTVLLTSPWPESLFAFAPMWGELTVDFGLIAVDLPGFGGSAGSAAGFTPDAMADFLAAFIGDVIAGPVHGVGPDVGTAIMLAAASKTPELFHSITVGSGAVAVPLMVSGLLVDIISASDAAVAAIPGRGTCESVLHFDRYSLPQQIRLDYLDSYDGDRFAESARFVRSYPQTLPALARTLASITTPTMIISGAKDPFVPWANGQWLHERLPHSELHVLPCGHFTHEDASEDYARLLARWVTGGHLRSRLGQSTDGRQNR